MSRVQLGDKSYIGEYKVHTWTSNNVVIPVGKYSSIAGDVSFIIDGNHRIDNFSSFPFREILNWTECPVNNWGKSIPTVGNDVWIGMNTVIYSGVDIGDGAVVAGQSVVTKPVPPYAIVAGNPAQIKKYRFNDEQISKLLEYKWWDLPEDVIRTELIPVMNDIDAVIEKLHNLRKLDHS